MAYTDYSFYTETFKGDVITEDEFDKYAERASGFIDIITFDRLVDALPTDEKAQVKIKKAVCAVAEVLSDIEAAKALARKQVTGANVIQSVSAGSESITYANAADSAKKLSATYSAVGNPLEENKLLESAARMYLTGVTNDDGVLLMYAGV